MTELDAPVLPHMGWNTVDAPEDSVLFRGIRDERFYFVHSYAAQQWHLQTLPPFPAPRLTWCTYGSPFLAAVENGPSRRRSSTPRSRGMPASGCSRIGSAASGGLVSQLVPNDFAQAPELILLPAVDIAGGQAVRLTQGEAGSETDYGDPVDAAVDWARQGAQWIHLVDLDAAFGRGSNAAIIRRVIAQVKGVQVEVSGGIRDDASLEARSSRGLRASTSARRRSRTQSGRRRSSGGTETRSPSVSTCGARRSRPAAGRARVATCGLSWIGSRRHLAAATS